MTKEFWVNLPVKSVARSREFFTKMGFSFSQNYGNGPTSAPLMLGQKGVIVMLFEEAMFAGFAGNEITDTTKSTEVLFSIDAESKDEVDEMAIKAVAAGGVCNHMPHEMAGWMYGCLFMDLDGHRWNVLYMDMTKMG